jgi:dUTP pyrophosphatase
MIRYFCDYELVRGTKDASGYDLRCTRSQSRQMYPGERWLVPTSLRLAMPRGIGAFVCSRSGLALNHGVIVLNAPGVIDADYRGEISVTLINHGSAPVMVNPGDRIAQLMFQPVWFPEDSRMLNPEINSGISRVWNATELGSTDRGAGGHGSTGVS